MAQKPRLSDDEQFLVRLTGEETLAIWKLRSPRAYSVVATMIQRLNEVNAYLKTCRDDGLKIPREVIHELRAPFHSIGVALDWVEEHPGELTEVEADLVDGGAP